MKNLTGKRAIIKKLTNSEALIYPDLKIGMIVEIDHEHFNGGSFYVRSQDGKEIIGRVDRKNLAIAGVDRTKPSWGNTNGHLIVNFKKSGTYKMVVWMGNTEKGKQLFMTWSSLKSIFNQLNTVEQE